MKKEVINYLVNEASKWGAKGQQVIGWIPPRSACDDEKGHLVLKDMSQERLSGSDETWYRK